MEKRKKEALQLLKQCLHRRQKNIYQFCMDKSFPYQEMKALLEDLYLNDDPRYWEYVNIQCCSLGNRKLTAYDEDEVLELMEKIYNGSINQRPRMKFDIIDYYEVCPFRVERLNTSLELLRQAVRDYDINADVKKVVVNFQKRYHLMEEASRLALLQIHRQIIINSVTMFYGPMENEIIIKALEQLGIPLTNTNFQDMFYRYVEDRMPPMDKQSKGFMKRL